VPDREPTEHAPAATWWARQREPDRQQREPDRQRGPDRRQREPDRRREPDLQRESDRQREPERRPPPATEPTPWATGLTVTGFSAVVVLIVVVTLSLALGAASDWLALIANLVIALGLAPSVWLARRAPVWRWVAYGVVTGIVVAWIALLFTAL
jgi:hypothetical protein